MKMAIVGAMLALLSALAQPANAETFKWKVVGGDPCNPETGCTLQWALGKTEWPDLVQDLLKEAVTNTSPAQIEICTGWEGWMTWGKNSPKFRAETIADWGPAHCESALHWSVTFDATDFHLIKVNKCGNWGGWTEEAIPPQPPSEMGPPLGVVPITSCPE